MVIAFMQVYMAIGISEDLTSRNFLCKGLYSHIINPNGLESVKTGESYVAGENKTYINSFELPVQSWFPEAPALPDLPGDVIRIENTDQLFNAVENVKPGGIIAIANGHYQMPRSLVIRTNNVTIRSESDDRTKVILDFESSMHEEGVVINSTTGFMLASLTVQNIKQNGIKINSNLGVDKVTIYNVISHNVWQRHIKGPHVPDNEDGSPSWVEECRVQYCLFYNDRPKTLDDEPYEKENPDNFNGNYVGGIDIMEAKSWIISDNVFIGIRGRTGSGRGGIFMWHNGVDCIIERNIFINNDSGICLGNSSARGERRHCTGFIVRNNFITRTNANEGIFAAHTRDCQILNNTVHNPGTGRLIRIVHANDGLIAEGNVFSGTSWGVSIEETDNSVPISFRNNLNRLSTEDFVDPGNGNLHLKSTATDIINKGPTLEKVVEDIDCQIRDNKPDLGADEYGGIMSGTHNDNEIELKCIVFPNPTKNNLILQTAHYDNIILFYRLFDLNGKLLKRKKITGRQMNINMSRYDPAVYFLKIGMEEINSYSLIASDINVLQDNYDWIDQKSHGKGKTIKIIKIK